MIYEYILGKVNVGVSKLVGTCLISFFRCQSRHNGVTATEAQWHRHPNRHATTPHADNTASPYANATPHVTTMLHVATAPHAVAALMCEPRGASGRRSRRKSPRTDKALPTRQCSDFNAPRAARRTPRRNQCRCICHSNRSPLTAVNRRHSPPPPRCNWLCASVRKFCWAMVLGCTRLIECSGYFFLVQLTLCTLYNLTKNTIVNVPTKGQLNSEWIYEVIVSPKMPTKHLKDFCPGSLLEGRAEILQFFSEFNWPLCKV